MMLLGLHKLIMCASVFWQLLSIATNDKRGLCEQLFECAAFDALDQGGKAVFNIFTKQNQNFFCFDTGVLVVFLHR